MHIEAHLGEAERDRGSWDPRHWREVDAGDPREMSTASKGGGISLGAPMGGRRWGEGRLLRIDEGITGGEDARNGLSAGRAVLLRKILEGKGVRAREEMCRAIIPLQRFGNGVRTGCDARVPKRGEGMRMAFPSHHRTEQTPPCHPGHITHHVVAVERHVVQGFLHMLDGLDRPLEQRLPMAQKTAEPADVLRRAKRWRA